MLEPGLHLLADADLLAQFASAYFHPLLEVGIHRAQTIGILSTQYAAGDLMGDEGQQFGVARTECVLRIVTLQGNNSDDSSGILQRGAYPADDNRAVPGCMTTGKAAFDFTLLYQASKAIAVHHFGTTLAYDVLRQPAAQRTGRVDWIISILIVGEFEAFSVFGQ